MSLLDTSCHAPDQRLISLQTVCLIVAYFREKGLPVGPLLANTGLTIDDLEKPGGLITPAQEQQVFANAVTASRCPLMSLDLGQSMRVSAYGQLGYAMLSAATLGESLNVMLTFPVLLGSYFRLSLEPLDDGLIAFRADHYRESPTLKLFNVQLCLSSTKAMMDDVLGTPLALAAVHLSRPRPAYADAYKDYFGDCPVLGNQGAERLVFHVDALKACLPLADPVTHFEAYRQCQIVQDSYTTEQSTLLSRLSAQLEQQLEAPPSLEDLATQMHCTPRTLRRHLNRVGSGYQKLLDRLRFQRAKQLLNHEQLPIYEIAEQLGFSETASFRHAFMRWSGTTPRAWRQGQHHTDSSRY